MSGDRSERLRRTGVTVIDRRVGRAGAGKGADIGAAVLAGSPSRSRGRWAAVAPLVVAVALAATPGCSTGTSGRAAEESELTAPTAVSSTALDGSTAATNNAPVTATPVGGAPKWEEIARAAIPALCSHAPATLVNGKNQQIGSEAGSYELRRELPGGQPGMVDGLASADAGLLTAVVASCNAGGVGKPSRIELFSSGGRYYAGTDLTEIDWAGIGLNRPADDGVSRIFTNGKLLTVDLGAIAGDDCKDCAPTPVAVTLRAGTHRLTVVDARPNLGD